MTSAGALKVRPYTWLVLIAGSVGGLAMFVWPLLTTPPPGTAHHADAPFIFVVILPLMIAVLLAELSSGGLDVKAIAMLGVLSAVGAALRPIGTGTAGIELVFFLLILAGRVYGAGFGFVLGSTTLFASALITGGVGPWLPFQMLASSWVGLGAGLLPRCRGRRELALLAGYGVVAAYVYGFLLNMWFWPYSIGIAVAGTNPNVQFVPGASVTGNLHRFVRYSLVSSTFGWDTGRAITNALAITLLGSAVLGALRRAERRAAFHPHIAFVARPVTE